MNQFCQCEMAGFCDRHKIQKNQRQFRYCRGESQNADCGRKHWVAWERGLLGATAPDDPVLNPEWPCESVSITDEQLEIKLKNREIQKAAATNRTSYDGCKVGSRIKQIIKDKYGRKSRPGCKCNQRAADMDRMGCSGCEESFDTIVDWLCEGAAADVWIKPVVALNHAARIASKLITGTERDLIREEAAKLLREAIDEEKNRINSSARARMKLKGTVWQYGVTTTSSRLNTYLPRTLASLSKAGFDKPMLFVDGVRDSLLLEPIKVDGRSLATYQHTLHDPPLKTFGNWITGLWELYIRQPLSQYYAMFQDDFITYPNLRKYLESCEFPTEGEKRGYWNLYTFPKNQQLANGTEGWFKSNQRGLGAVALIFCRECVMDLLSSKTAIVERPTTPGKRAWTNIDGGIVTALNKAGWVEYCHNPSLVQHIGDESSMQGAKHAKAVSFRGEEFDASGLIH